MFWFSSPSSPRMLHASKFKDTIFLNYAFLSPSWIANFSRLSLSIIEWDSSSFYFKLSISCWVVNCMVLICWSQSFCFASHSLFNLISLYWSSHVFQCFLLTEWVTVNKFSYYSFCFFIFLYVTCIFNPVKHSSAVFHSVVLFLNLNNYSLILLYINIAFLFSSVSLRFSCSNCNLSLSLVLTRLSQIFFSLCNIAAHLFFIFFLILIRVL